MTFSEENNLVVDGGREFLGREFVDAAERLGIMIECGDGDAPWERGRTKRQGGMLK